MSVTFPSPTKTDLLSAATRILYNMMCTHMFINFFIVFVQVNLHLISPMATVFLINVNLLCLAERSWRVQSRTMPIWHPLVQLFFCVSRMFHGAVAIMAAVLWIRVALLCVRMGGC